MMRVIWVQGKKKTRVLGAMVTLPAASILSMYFLAFNPNAAVFDQMQFHLLHRYGMRLGDRFGRGL
jgi:hypothetical protein